MWHGAGPLDTAASQRAMAKRIHGWVRSDGKDYCAVCWAMKQETKQKNRGKHD